MSNLLDNKPEKDKKQIPLRLSPTLLKEITAWAENDFRSINGQIEYLLTECVRQKHKNGSPAPTGFVKSDKE